MAIDIKLVKELRERTLAGFGDCKLALEKTNNDMNKAIEWLKEKGIAKAVKKAGAIATEGVANVLIKGNYGIIFELNVQTDFAIKNDIFKQLVKDISTIALENYPTTLEELLNLKLKDKTLQTIIMEKVGVIGENIQLRRYHLIKKLDDQIFGHYIHMNEAPIGGKVASIIVLTKNATPTLAKDLAMHIAAMKPTHLKITDIPKVEQDKEKAIILKQMKEDEKLKSKTKDQLEKIAQGKLIRVLSEIVLEQQDFVKEPSKKVSNYLKENNVEAIEFVRYEVGEGIDVVKKDFAAEVEEAKKRK